jgi:hypothetical protein
MWELTNGAYFYGINRKILRRNSNLEIMFLWFPKGEKTHLGKFKKRWFGPFRVQYCLPNNIILLVFVNNFEPNLVLINVNKLKPYTYVTITSLWNLKSEIISLHFTDFTLVKVISV